MMDLEKAKKYSDVLPDVLIISMMMDRALFQWGLFRWSQSNRSVDKSIAHQNEKRIKIKIVPYLSTIYLYLSFLHTPLNINNFFPVSLVISSLYLRVVWICWTQHWKLFDVRSSYYRRNKQEVKKKCLNDISKKIL